MFEIVVRGIKYIKGIPIELTEKALKEGLIRRGSDVGVEARERGRDGSRVMLEIRISEDGQAGLFKPGAVIPVDNKTGSYRINSSWQDYLKILSSEKPFCGKIRKKVRVERKSPSPSRG